MELSENEKVRLLEGEIDRLELERQKLIDMLFHSATEIQELRSRYKKAPVVKANWVDRLAQFLFGDWVH